MLPLLHHVLDAFELLADEGIADGAFEQMQGLGDGEAAVEEGAERFKEL